MTAIFLPKDGRVNFKRPYMIPYAQVEILDRTKNCFHVRFHGHINTDLVGQELISVVADGKGL